MRTRLRRLESRSEPQHRTPSRPASSDGPPGRVRPARLSVRVLALLALVSAIVVPEEATAQCVDNPIVCENQQAGTDTWRIDGPISGDVDAEIQGYASATSVDLGESIDLHVTVEGGNTWVVEIYRMGWYGGAGGRAMLAAGPFAGIDQGPCGVLAANPSPPPLPDPNASVECDWSVGYTLTIPSSWASGLYLARLEASDGYQSYVPFVVRDDARAADFLYVQSVMTYQSYNRYPGGTAQSMSFYNGGTASQPWLKRLSFDRPYGSTTFTRNNESPFSARADGSGGFFTWDFPMIQWLEQQGHDVAYATNVDLHVDPARLLEVRAMISVGHDEYWTDAMATAASNARDAGTHLAFFSGNHVFGTVAMQPGTDGTPNRMMQGLTKAGAPGQGSDPSIWWDRPGYPDKHKRQALLGQANTGCCVRKPITYANLPWIVSAADHWVFEGTGFQNGDGVPGLLGYEPDAHDPAFPAPTNLHFTLLSDSPFTFTAAAAPAVGDSSWLNTWPLPAAHSTIYQAPSGAWVFSAGTTDWAWGLATPFAAGAEPYDVAIGSGDPTQQGHVSSFTGTGSGSLVLDGGLPAWRVDGSGGAASWTRRVGLEGSEAQGALRGNTLTSVFRMESGGFITNYYSTRTKRYLPIISLDGGNLEVQLETSPGTGTTYTLASGPAATAYHTHTVQHDAANGGTATYFFDGTPIATWGGSTSAVEGVHFGQGSTGIAGVALFRSVAFAPDAPLAPDPRIQTMTENILARFAVPFDPAAPIGYDASLGDGLPARQGWIASLSNDGSGSWVANDGGAPAFFADGLAGRATWLVVPTPATKALAASRGWRIRSELRVASGGFVTDYYADGARRYMPILSLVGNALRVQLEGGGTHDLAFDAAASDYHVHEVRFDPTTGLATYFFDGLAIETWAGSATSQNQITFGQGSTGIAGSAYYRSMTFSLLAPPVPVPGLSPLLALVAAASAVAAAATAATRGGRATTPPAAAAAPAPSPSSRAASSASAPSAGRSAARRRRDRIPAP